MVRRLIYIGVYSERLGQCRTFYAVYAFLIKLGPEFEAYGRWRIKNGTERKAA